MINLFLILLIIFQIKHFLADYPFQGQYMMGKFQSGKDFILPLALHCLIHSSFTIVISYVFTSNVLLAVKLFCFDFSMHFIMDRIKASPKLLGRFNPKQRYYWWAFGFDQMIHHLTHYAIIYIIVINY